MILFESVISILKVFQFIVCFIYANELTGILIIIFLYYPGFIPLIYKFYLELATCTSNTPIELQCLYHHWSVRD